jgi:hypothetical protein
MFIFKMKPRIRTVFILSLSLIVCVGCSNEDNDPSVETSDQSVTTTGTISGTIENYVSGEINNIECHDGSNGGISGKSTISSKGKFSMTLSIDNMNLDTWSREKIPAGVTVSDPNALYGAIYLGAYKDATELGTVEKSNSQVEQGDEPNDLGDAFSKFVYSNKLVTIKGTNSDDDLYNYNFTLKKGWNEIVFKVTAQSTNSSGNVVRTISITNDIPSDLKWKYFKYHSYNVRSNVSRLCQHKQVRLFSNGR